LSSIGVLGSRRSDSASSGVGGLDMLSRWDRIPVNIFRRSRALASNHRRGMVSQDDMMGTMSSLALTAIKSSRQRRALVNTTLLAQHTLPAEAALQQQAFKHAMRGGSRRGGQMPRTLSSVMMAPPPPPPTPLSQIVGNSHKQSSAVDTAPIATDPSTSASKGRVLEGNGGSVDPSSKARSAGNMAAADSTRVSAFLPVDSQITVQNGPDYPHHYRQLSFSGRAASDIEIEQPMTAPSEQQQQPSGLLSRSSQMHHPCQSEAGNVVHRLESQVHAAGLAQGGTDDLNSSRAATPADPSMSG
ncbi:hypothetical protein LPJ75_007377, partial [Coemansia sp. RSA 2598]